MPFTSFADSGRLLARVSHAVKKGEKVTFLFGSALTAPSSYPEQPGVPNAKCLLTEALQVFDGSEERGDFEKLIRSEQPLSIVYQQAMQFVIDCRGQDALNRLIADAVLKAHIGDRSDKGHEALELDASGWFLRDAVEAVGQLVVEHQESFSAPILTSNFDPLIEVSVRRAGGQPTAIFLPADGQFSNVYSPGSTQVVHLHGFWRGTDTLHTPAQLTRYRPQLKGALRSLLRNTTLIVMAYGGWNDVFTKTLVEVIAEQNECLNVLWTFYSDSDEDIIERNKELLENLEPLAGQRVVFYKGVDCHVFLPSLRARLPSRVAAESPSSTNPKIIITAGAGSDHPPQALSWVGREKELRVLLSSQAAVIAITGMGGTGKSTLASKYLEFKNSADEIAFWCWADCKEEGNTLRTQLIRMIERISRGILGGEKLKDSRNEELIEVFFEQIGIAKALVVFDNIDQYVDVEECKTVGLMRSLMERAMAGGHEAQFVFTSRPQLNYESSDFLQLRIDGLTYDETVRLFEVSGVKLDPATAEAKITEVHRLTMGHPLALSLIASQVARNRTDLDELLHKIETGYGAGVENPVLPNIWETLNAKQQTVLRYLAELVHPETEQRVGNYLGNALNFNQFSKAIKALKALNLVVVKSPGDGAQHTLELHPLIKDFIRRKFLKEERTPYIDSIIHFCDRMISRFKATVLRVSFDVLENWTSKVELCLAAERNSEALEALSEVEQALVERGYSEEFIRLAIPVLGRYTSTPTEEDAKRHDKVSRELIKLLAQLEKRAEFIEQVARINSTVDAKTARFIYLCDTCAYGHWLLYEYDKAKAWALKGVELKLQSNLDTRYDCGHTLALIQRDSGEVDPALDYFLVGEDLEKVLSDPTKFEKHGGEFFGNIGRCLYMQKRYAGALTCLKMSANLLERSDKGDKSMNKAWAAFWIGECWEALSKFDLAYIAFLSAQEMWESLSPCRQKDALGAADRVAQNIQVLPISVRDKSGLIQSYRKSLSL